MGYLCVVSFFLTIYYSISLLRYLRDCFKELREVKILDFIKETKEGKRFLVCATLFAVSGTLSMMEINKNELERKQKIQMEATASRDDYIPSQKPVEQPKPIAKQDTIEQPKSVAPTMNADWRHVITENDISFNIDMNSIEFTPDKKIVFSMIAENQADAFMFSLVTVNTSSRQHRIETAQLIDKKTLNIRQEHPTTKWMPIDKGSSLDKIVNYIFEHHPATKDRVPASSTTPGQTANTYRQNAPPYPVPTRPVSNSDLNFSVKKLDVIKDRDGVYSTIEILFTISNATNSKIYLSKDNLIARKSGYNTVKAFSGRFYLKTNPVTFKINSIELFPGDTIEEAEFLFPIDDKGNRPLGWTIYYAKSSNEFIPIANID